MSHHDEAHEESGPDLQSPAYPGTNHETTDINLRPLVLFVIGLVASIALIMVVISMQISFYVRGQSTGQETPIRRPLPTLTDGPPVEPRIQEFPEMDMEALRAEESATLSKLGWIDRSKGIAEIPIDEAMKILVRKGLPTRKTPAPPEGEKPPETRTGPPTEATPKEAR